MLGEKVSTILRARWVLPILKPPVSGGYVAIRGSEIEYVDTKPYGRPARDLGNVAILPGFINAHTHLEFSDLTAPLGSPGQPLPAWIRLVVGHRRAQAAALREDLASHRENAVRQGIQESLASGVVSLCEIATRDTPFGAYDSSPVSLCVCAELLGLDPAKMPEILSFAERLIDFELDQLPGWASGVSPHAPYTVSLKLMQKAVELAQSGCGPLVMHLAESQEELELLANQSGPFRELLESVGAWFPEAFCPGTRPLEYLLELTKVWRSYVIHGNYLAGDELDFLVHNNERLTLVHCPRTHAYFAHPRFPLAEYLKRGISIAIGTDSRASNPDLDFMAELRFLAALNPDVAPSDILYLGTYAGAKARGLEEVMGSLVRGKSADLIAIEIPGRNQKDPAEEILGGEGRVIGVMIGGQWIIEPPG